MSDVAQAVTRLREQTPLVLNVTNYVSVDLVANGLLSVGASPVMSDCDADIVDLARIAAALVINLGTVNAHVSRLASVAARQAQQYHCPLVLDPVGAGASAYRTEQSLAVLTEADVAILRANSSEIIALAGAQHQVTKGVDSQHASEDACEAGTALAKRYGCTVLISGVSDWVIGADGTRIEKIDGGSPMMRQITGAGCLLTALCGAFHAVLNDPFESAAVAARFYGQCATMAGRSANRPGSFRQALLDQLNV